MVVPASSSRSTGPTVSAIRAVARDVGAGPASTNRRFAEEGCVLSVVADHHSVHLGAPGANDHGVASRRNRDRLEVQHAAASATAAVPPAATSTAPDHENVDVDDVDADGQYFGFCECFLAHTRAF